ncbi:MAG: cold shock domain-containing protein [Actinomycetota bacterium]|nr:cold shock domain-containing protein [Actinomycetota bacterium]
MPQGTIKDFDDDARTGTLLLDDGEEVHIDAASIEGAGLRFLRIGQRVKFEVVQEGGRRLARTLRIVSFD